MEENNLDIIRFEDEGGAIFSEEKQTVGDLCPECENWTLINFEGCSTCLTCGYSLCEI
jgi:hypothetical protein